MMINFMLADKCNLKCSMCQFVSTSTGKEFPFEKYVELLDQLRDIRIFSRKITSIRLDGNREPLLYPRIAEAVEAATKRGFYTQIVTNGILLNKETSMSLIKSGVNLMIVSIGGVTPNVYAYVQGANRSEKAVKNQLETVIENVKNFIKIKQEMRSQCRLQVNYLLSSETSKEAREAYFFWKDAGVNAMFFQTPYWCESEDDFEKYARRQCTSVMCDPFIISPLGDVHPCCFWEAEDVVLGNCFKNDFESIIKSDKFNAFFKALASFDTENIPVACKRCAGLSVLPQRLYF